jgi:hypothetical protein
MGKQAGRQASEPAADRPAGDFRAEGRNRRPGSGEGGWLFLDAGGPLAAKSSSSCACRLRCRAVGPTNSPFRLDFEKTDLIYNFTK